MRIKLIILTLLFLLFGVGSVFAIDPPSLINPQNNSIVLSGPTFSWQAVSGSVEYNILIDDEPTVTSPYAKTPYYPANPSYSPQNLNPGTYYWKVKVKDSSGNWSSWSSIWSFTLSNSTPTPTPAPTSTPTPVPTSAPTPSPTATDSPNTSFTISSTPSQINSDQSFIIQVNLSLLSNPNTNFYLKGAFKTSDGSNYFGQTKVSNNWVKNGSSYSSQFPITTDSSGNWSGSIEIQPDSDDSGFTGGGDYIFKVARYTSTGSGPIWSNESTIKIIAVTQNSKPEDTTNSSSSTSSAPPKSQSSPTPQTFAKILNSTPRPYIKIASIAGVSTSATKSATPSAKIEVRNQKQINPLFWIGLIFIFAGAGSVGYIYLRKR